MATKEKTELKPMGGTGGVATTAPVSSAFGDDEVSINDLTLPKIYLMQGLSKQVEEGNYRPGQVLAGSSNDDPAAQLLVDKPGETFTAFVLSREKFAATTANGSLEFHPDKRRDPNDRQSWEGWFFELYIPAIGMLLPVRVMLWKSGGRKAAQVINTLIQRAVSEGNSDPLPIKLTSRATTNPTGQKYYEWVAMPVDLLTDTISDEDRENAVQVRQTAAAVRDARKYENDAPAAHDGPAIS